MKSSEIIASVREGVFIHSGLKKPVESVLEIRGDTVCCFKSSAGDCYLMEVWIVAVFIVFLNE
jgi:hypothetical protein